MITVVIPTYNSQKTLNKCLASIFKQSFPINKLEVIVVDNYSQDQTLEIAKKYPVKILMNTIKDNLVSKMMALRKAKGDYFIYFDSDIDLVGENWFQKALKPLQDDPKIVASFPRFVATFADNPLVRYLSYDLLQRDPIYEFFSPSIESTVISTNSRYSICEYKTERIPPAGLCLYRKQALLAVWDITKEDRFLELDNLTRLVNAGFKYFAYVPQIGIHHPFINSILDLLKKRLRNIKRNYLNQTTPRLYRWFDLKTPLGITKVILWVLYATSIVLPLVRGIYKSIKNKDWACLYEPIIVFAETWIIILGFFWYSII